ncbi:interleukin-1 receptor-like 1 [Danio aesculapii]|uniref:interleukin-1 receptor-like 1 n=1 Tax=Danio aesculapii TaxID=1142201 RepID=UPI0024C0CDD9|nr:interleukin-1 receptor-like 1 [Danio aesculapii]
MIKMMMMIILLIIESVLVSSYALHSTVGCEQQDGPFTLNVRAGESLRLPYHYDEFNNSYTWFRNLSRTMKLEQIGTEESQRVHHNKSTLYILHLTLNDTGTYITHWRHAENVCYEIETDIVVYENFSRDLLYGETSNSEMICPICENQPGSFIWYKDFTLIPNQSKRSVRIRNSSKESLGIYTCVCTWDHHGIKYNTSGSRELVIKEKTVRIPPQFRLPIKNSIVNTNIGAELLLNCSVLFGTEVCNQCFVHWEKNGIKLNEMKGYEEKYSKKGGFAQSLLNITAVSELDLQSEFRCTAMDEYEVIYVSVTLKREPSVLTVILVFIFIFTVLLLFAGTLRWFALDLVLFARKIFIKFYRTEDGKLYDAYVIYQRSGLDEETGQAVSEFVNGALLPVLESSCGYKLFIHGRDDLPGEDSANLIQTQIQLSRRLLIILSAEGVGGSAEAYDLQAGLHQTLVQGETPVIIIQLGLMQDYSHLPLGLQHLLRKRSALLWRGGEASLNSRFWKRVRYRMPAASATIRRSRASNTAAFHWQSLSV